MTAVLLQGKNCKIRGCV